MAPTSGRARVAGFDVTEQPLDPRVDDERDRLADGEIVAARLLAARANDGWNAPPPAYVLPATPGNWQPVAPANAAATFTHYPSVLPFAITSPGQFVPGPPPAMTSAQYAADLNEVKELGAVNSTTRTADQTQVARLWANVNTPTNFLLVWNNVARTVSEARNLTTVERARLFALTNMALHDALQVTLDLRRIVADERRRRAAQKLDDGIDGLAADHHAEGRNLGAGAAGRGLLDRHRRSTSGWQRNGGKCPRSYARGPRNRPGAPWRLDRLVRDTLYRETI